MNHPPSDPQPPPRSDRPGNAEPAQQVPLRQTPNIVSFDELCPDGEEVWIRNAEQVYRLRRTRQGKLILTK